jgi:ubiquinone/menaquinone biosynthesis C-methylase UbiE
LSDSADRQAHWEKVYQTKAADSVSWYRQHLNVSLELLEQGGLSRTSQLIDIGGGASTLVDDLLERGMKGVTVLDISAAALAVPQSRLGVRASAVNWIVADVLQAELPESGFDFWHDRAVFHFLTDTVDARTYAQQAERVVKPGGYALISGFAPDGPERCSGLPVARRSADDIARIFAPVFSLQQARAERHLTPAGTAQSFAYALLKRR